MASTSAPDRPRRPETALPAGQVRVNALPALVPTVAAAVGLPAQAPEALTATQSGVTERELVSAKPLGPGEHPAGRSGG